MLTEKQIKTASKIAVKKMDKRLGELKVEKPDLYNTYQRFREAKIFIPSLRGKK